MSNRSPEFQVDTAATDLQLLTIQQLRVGAGLVKDNSSRDEELTELGLRVAADIAVACRVADGGVYPPTLRSETVTNTFQWPGGAGDLILSRRFVSGTPTITEDAVAVVAADYAIKRAEGLLTRKSSDWPADWPSSIIVIQYVAGFSVVPAELAGAAQSLVQWRISESAYDPLVKSIRTALPDLEDRSVDRWVGTVPGSDSGGPVPTHIMRLLTRFINP